MTENETELNPKPIAPIASPGVTRDEVRHVAALASLELTAAEEERMERDLNSIIGYIVELNELDTTNVLPLSQISEILTQLTTIGPPCDALRVDEPRSSLSRLTVMAEAPATDGVFFKVPKVIER